MGIIVEVADSSKLKLPIAQWMFDMIMVQG